MRVTTTSARLNCAVRLGDTSGRPPVRVTTPGYAVRLAKGRQPRHQRETAGAGYNLDASDLDALIEATPAGDRQCGLQRDDRGRRHREVAGRDTGGRPPVRVTTYSSQSNGQVGSGDTGGRSPVRVTTVRTGRR